MRLNKKIAATFNIKEGEELSIFLLMLISFFMGTAVAFFYTASTSMFLAVFSPKTLPYTYIASGVLGYLIWLVSSGLSKKLPLSALLLAYMLFLTISVVLINAGIHLGSYKWLPFLMYVWVRVFTFVNAVVFWALAGRIFDLRQGKRLFGLVSAGEVISTIIGFFSIPLLLKIISVKDLVTVSVAGLVLCTLTLIVILKTFKSKIQSVGPVAQNGNKSTGKSFRVLFSDNYLKHIFFLAILPMFAMYFVDFIFLAQTKTEYPDNNFLAGFLGIFFGFAAVAELLIKLFLSGRLIDRYGIKLGLVILPALMFASTFLASAFGAVYGAAGMFYSFIVFTKFSERVLRSSMNDPSFQILYQPLPEVDRIAFQTQIEGVPKAIGTVIGGAVLLAFASFSMLNIVHYNFIYLFILAAWVKLAADTYNNYRKTLKDVLTKKETGNKSVKKDNSEYNNLFIEAAEKHPEQIANIFDLFNKINPLKSETVLLGTLMQTEKNINRITLRILEDNLVINALPVLDYCIEDEKYADIKDEIAKVRNILNTYKETTFELLTDMIKSGDKDRKLFATVMLGYSTRFNSIKLLNSLLKDSDPEIKKAALISAGRLKRIELRSAIVEALFVPEYANYAAAALRNTGPAVFDELEVYFTRFENNKKYLKLIIYLYGEFGNKQAIELLRKKINYPDKEIRQYVFYALNKSGYTAASSEISFIKTVIEEEIGFIVWIIASLNDIKEKGESTYLYSALNVELNAKRDYIFVLLAIIYDAETLKKVRLNMNAGSMQAKAFALEIIDLTVSEELKEIVIPLFEDLNNEECLAMFKDKFPQEILSYQDRLTDIIHKDFSRVSRWTKACAMQELQIYFPEMVANIFPAFLNHSDPLLMDTAIRGLYQADEPLFNRIVERLALRSNSVYKCFEKGRISIYNVVIYFKKQPLFSSFQENELVPLAVNACNLTDYNQENPSLTFSAIVLYNQMAEDYEFAKKIVSFLSAQNNFEIKEFV